LPGAGDELQGIKKGVLELADAIAVNKADGEGAERAHAALADLRAALRYLPRKRPAWATRTLAISGLTGAGLDALWNVVEEHHAALSASGELATLRAAQQRSWMWSLITERLEDAFRAHPQVAAKLSSVEAEVRGGRVAPTAAADELLRAFGIRRGLTE
jgi:LAO/AO transport system kinase